MTQGLIPRDYSRFEIVDAYAAFVDWWNVGGLTERCRQKGRSISGALSRMRYHNPGEYLESGGAQDVYLGLVQRYHPDEYDEECRRIDEENKE